MLETPLFYPPHKRSSAGFLQKKTGAASSSTQNPSAQLNTAISHRRYCDLPLVIDSSQQLSIADMVLVIFPPGSRKCLQDRHDRPAMDHKGCAFLCGQHRHRLAKGRTAPRFEFLHRFAAGISPWQPESTQRRYAALSTSSAAFFPSKRPKSVSRSILQDGMLLVRKKHLRRLPCPKQRADKNPICRQALFLQRLSIGISPPRTRVHRCGQYSAAADCPPQRHGV